MNIQQEKYQDSQPTSPESACQHLWVKGECSGKICQKCQKKSNNYENEHKWESGCRGRICKRCNLREDYRAHTWTKGNCRGQRCTTCGVTKGNYEDVHDYVMGKCHGLKCTRCPWGSENPFSDEHNIVPGQCSGHTCTNCDSQTTEDYRNAHSMMPSMCTGYLCVNCDFKTKDYVEVCEMTVPGKCRGMSCRFCSKWATKDFRRTHKMVYGQCRGKRCLYCDKKTSYDYQEHHRVVTDKNGYKKCKTCNKMMRWDYQEEDKFQTLDPLNATTPDIPNLKRKKDRELLKTISPRHSRKKSQETFFNASKRSQLMGNSVVANLNASVSLPRGKNGNFPAKSQNSDFTFFRTAFNKKKMSEKATNFAHKLIQSMQSRPESRQKLGRVSDALTVQQLNESLPSLNTIDCTYQNQRYLKTSQVRERNLSNSRSAIINSSGEKLQREDVKEEDKTQDSLMEKMNVDRRPTDALEMVVGKGSVAAMSSIMAMSEKSSKHSTGREQKDQICRRPTVMPDDELEARTTPHDPGSTSQVPFTLLQESSYYDAKPQVFPSPQEDGQTSEQVPLRNFYPKHIDELDCTDNSFAGTQAQEFQLKTPRVESTEQNLLSFCNSVQPKPSIKQSAVISTQRSKNSSYSRQGFQYKATKNTAEPRQDHGAVKFVSPTLTPLKGMPGAIKEGQPLSKRYATSFNTNIKAKIGGVCTIGTQTYSRYGDKLGTGISTTSFDPEQTQGTSQQETRLVPSPRFARNTSSTYAGDSTRKNSQGYINHQRTNLATEYLEVIPSQDFLDQRQKQLISALQIKQTNLLETPEYEKTQEEEEEIADLLATSLLTQNLDQKDIEKVVAAMQPREFQEGETIVKYGDLGEEYFLLAEGNVQVFVYNKDTDPDDPQLGEKVSYTRILGRGSGFGEIALLQSGERTATIRANDSCKAYVLDGATFKAIVAPSIKSLQVLDGLRSHYSKLSVQEPNQLTESSQVLQISIEGSTPKEDLSFEKLQHQALGEAQANRELQDELDEQKKAYQKLVDSSELRADSLQKQLDIAKQNSAMQIKDLQEENADLKQRMSQMLEDVIGSMMAYVLQFLMIDQNIRLMIDKVQTFLVFELASAKQLQTEGSDAKAAFEPSRLHHLLNSLSQHLKYDPFQIEDVQEEMKDLREHKIGNFDELKLVLRRLFSRQTEFRDDWQVITGELDKTEHSLKMCPDQSIERFVSLFSLMSIRQEVTIENVTEYFKEDAVNFEPQRESNGFLACLVAVYRCIVVTFCCVFNYRSSKTVDGYEYDGERIFSAFDQLGYENVKTFDEMKKLSKQLFMPFGDEDSYLQVQAIDVCITLASAATSLALLIDFREEALEANIRMSHRQHLFDLVSISGALAVFQILIAFERFGSTYKLNLEKNPTKNRIILFIVKQILFGIVLELAQLALQCYLQSAIEQILDETSSFKTFAAVVVLTVIETLFKIYQMAKPVIDFNNQNTDGEDQIQCTRLGTKGIDCSAKRLLKSCKTWAIVLFTTAITFCCTLAMHEKFNRIDPNSPSLSVFGLTSTLSIANCELYSDDISTTAQCAKCASTWYISGDKTACQQEEDCNGIDQILEASGRCGCRDKERATLIDGQCLCRQDVNSHINNYQPLDHDQNSAYGMCICSQFFSRIDGRCELFKPDKVHCLDREADTKCCDDVPALYKEQCLQDRQRAFWVNKALRDAEVQPLSTIQWIYDNRINIQKVGELRVTKIDYKATAFLEAFQLTLSDRDGNSYQLPIQGKASREELDQVQTFEHGTKLDLENLFNKKNKPYDFTIQQDPDQLPSQDSRVLTITGETAVDSQNNIYISRAETHYFDPSYLQHVMNTKEAQAIARLSDNTVLIGEFAVKDRNTDSKISREELELLFKGLDEDYDVSYIMKMADINNNQHIDWREFVRINLKNYDPDY